MEASALTTASHSGLLVRRSPLLRLQSDEKLVALLRDGNDRAFEVLFDRYQSRLLAFCRHMLGSTQDAEDVLQDVFAAAHAALFADERNVTARPWLYRIARNRCLNFLRRPVAEGQDSMDVHPHQNGTTTLERVQRREELRAIVADVQELPETQRTALVLREIDDLSYTEIAQAMGTTLPAIKSLLVRARMSLAEASEARVLTCEEVRLELAEAAEGLSKVSPPARRHVRACAGCGRYRSQLRSTTKALSGLAPLGLLALVRKLTGLKIGGGHAAGSSAGSAGAGSAGGAAGSAGAGAGGAAGSAGAGAAAVGGSGAALGGATASAVSGLGGALGVKAAVGMATATLITAGAVGADRLHSPPARTASPTVATAVMKEATGWHVEHAAAARHRSQAEPQHSSTVPNAPDASAPTDSPPAPVTDSAPPADDPAAATPPDDLLGTDTSSDTDTTTPPDTSTTDSANIGEGTSTTGTAPVDGSSDSTDSTDSTDTTTDPVPPPDPVPVDPLPTTDSGGSTPLATGLTD